MNVRNEPGQKNLPDLSGTWKLDKSKGNYVQYSGLKPEAELLLIIEHAEPEIKVTRKSIWEGQERIEEATYYSDGRGELSRTFIGTLEGKSKSSWEKNEFVTRFSATSKNVRSGKINFDVIQEWKLSADSQTLTQTERVRQTTLSNRLSDRELETAMLNIVSGREIKRVFRRIP